MTVHSIKPIPEKFEKRKKRVAGFSGTPAERIRQKAVAARTVSRSSTNMTNSQPAILDLSPLPSAKDDHAEN